MFLGFFFTRATFLTVQVISGEKTNYYVIGRVRPDCTLSMARLDDPEKFLLSREMSENDGIIVRREKQIIRKGAPFRVKQVRGDKVRTRNPGVFIEINY